MSKKNNKKRNKIYWFEGVTEKGVKDLLNNENSKFRWLRPQRNRRVLVLLMALGLLLISMGSYWPTLKTNLNLSDGSSVVVYSVTAIFVILPLQYFLPGSTKNQRSSLC